MVFVYFCNFIAKSDQKPKTKNEKWNEQNISLNNVHLGIASPRVFEKKEL
jgi:hypothetical protein